MHTTRKVYHAIIPMKIRVLKSQIKENLFWNKKRKTLRKIIIDELESQPKITGEQKEILNYLRRNALRMIPYLFTEKYNSKKTEVKMDTSNGLRYVIHENKKLYFKRNWSVNKIKKYYNCLCAEQDDLSPHRYLTTEFNVFKEDVVVDAGAAEGIFSLNVIERIKKVYLFEPDLEWVEALKSTFSRYPERAVIIPKGLSNNSNYGFIKLDKYLGDQSTVNFIKLDVEGWELDSLKGSAATLSFNNNIRVAVCTYHRHDDEDNITDFLDNINFKCNTSKGYMIYIYDDSEKYLRRGLLRAEKNTKIQHEMAKIIIKS